MQNHRIQTRRELLRHGATVASLLMAAGMLPPVARAQGAGDAGGSAYASAAFQTRSLAELMRLLGASAPVESAEVSLQAPDVAENGAVVPLGAATTLPGVRRLLLLIENNPNLMAAMFELTDAVEPMVSTRVKMAESSDVFAVAMLADGRVLYARRHVKVVLGGCVA